MVFAILAGLVIGFSDATADHPRDARRAPPKEAGAGVGVVVAGGLRIKVNLKLGKPIPGRVPPKDLFDFALDFSK